MGAPNTCQHSRGVLNFACILATMHTCALLTLQGGVTPALVSDVTWCYCMWSHVMSCDLLWCHVIWWCRVSSCDVMWTRDLMWCHVNSWPLVMWSHVISWAHVMSCELVTPWAHVMSWSLMMSHDLMMSCDVMISCGVMWSREYTQWCVLKFAQVLTSQQPCTPVLPDLRTNEEPITACSLSS